jgi:hypothetical protein
MCVCLALFLPLSLVFILAVMTTALYQQLSELSSLVQENAEAKALIAVFQRDFALYEASLEGQVLSLSLSLSLSNRVCVCVCV